MYVCVYIYIYTLIYIYIYIYIYMTASVVWWSEFLVTDPEVPGWIPGTTKKKVVGLERGPLSLVSTTEELLGSNSSGSGLESREYGLGIRHADHVAPSIRKKLALTSLTNGGLSVGIVRLRTEATEFLYIYIYIYIYILIGVQTIHRSKLRMTESLCAFKCKRFRSTRHIVTFGIPL
jgi:hypothetical protein